MSEGLLSPVPRPACNHACVVGAGPLLGTAAYLAIKAVVQNAQGTSFAEMAASANAIAGGVAETIPSLDRFWDRHPPSSWSQYASRRLCMRDIIYPGTQTHANFVSLETIMQTKKRQFFANAEREKTVALGEHVCNRGPCRFTCVDVVSLEMHQKLMHRSEGKAPSKTETKRVIERSNASSPAPSPVPASPTQPKAAKGTRKHETKVLVLETEEGDGKKEKEKEKDDLPIESYNVGDRVWAKWSRFPFWPAVVLIKNPSSLLIAFYGDNSTETMRVTNRLRPMPCPEDAMFIAQGKAHAMSKQFLAAYELASAAIAEDKAKTKNKK